MPWSARSFPGSRCAGRRARPRDWWSPPNRAEPVPVPGHRTSGAASNSASAVLVGSGYMPPRAIRLRSAWSRSPVMPLGWSHSPQAARCRAAPGLPARDDRLDGGVGSGIVALPAAPSTPAARRTRRTGQVWVPRQLVQVGQGAGLGARTCSRRCVRRGDASSSIAPPRHHPGQRILLGTAARSRTGRAVGGVAGGDGDAGAEVLQPGGRLGGAGRCGPRREASSRSRSVGDTDARHQRPQAPGAAGGSRGSAGSSGGSKVGTILPVWRAWAMKRRAFGAWRMSKIVTGGGCGTPRRTSPSARSASPRSRPGLGQAEQRHATPGCSAATCPGSRMSVIPISMNRPPPPSPASRSDASVNSPASEFSTTSKPCPAVARPKAPSKSGSGTRRPARRPPPAPAPPAT